MEFFALRIRGLVFAMPRILLFFYHAFGFDGVRLSHNRRASPSLCLRPRHVSILRILGLVHSLCPEDVSFVLTEHQALAQTEFRGIWDGRHFGSGCRESSFLSLMECFRCSSVNSICSTMRGRLEMYSVLFGVFEERDKRRSHLES